MSPYATWSNDDYWRARLAWLAELEKIAKGKP
jgi:hypothetical protein